MEVGDPISLSNKIHVVVFGIAAPTMEAQASGFQMDNAKPMQTSKLYNPMLHFDARAKPERTQHYIPSLSFQPTPA
jgi:hypothetical protein